MQPTTGEMRPALYADMTRIPATDPLPAPPPRPGFFCRDRTRGLVVHMLASPENLRAVRALAAEALAVQGIAPDAVEAAQLVLSELVGNAVRAYGPDVPLVVEVYATFAGVAVNVHDPDPRHLPRRRGVALDDPEAESGRGLALLDLLAPAWHIQRSPIGKQIRCRLAHPSG